MSDMSGFGPDTGTSLGESIANSVGDGIIRWSPPAWKFGTRPSDDRGGM